jgi:hypothetical protein
MRHAAALLDWARNLLADNAIADAAMTAALLTAETYVHTSGDEHSAIVQAQAATEEVLRLATGSGRRREEALALRLLGQCALVQGTPAEAVPHLRASLRLLDEAGMALEAARTRLVLAQALAIGTATGEIPAEAATLLGEAQAQFVTSGAALDLAQAKQYAMTL